MPVRSVKAVNERHPRATIVMAARERHAHAEAAIDAIVAHTAPPYGFVYLDVQSPDALRERLARRRDEWGLEVMRFDEPMVGGALAALRQGGA